MSKGVLIVIDGGDGSGKATQTEALVRRLRTEGNKVERIDFPRYYDNFFGRFIGDCLAGRHGDFLKKDPYVASVLYAADRFESGSLMKGWLAEGKIVVADRYVSANQMHQGGKIRDPKKRKHFLKWLDTMEHEVFGIPRPTKIIYLDVPPTVARKLLKGSDKAKKKYLRGRKDLAENDQKHLEAARRGALKMLGEAKNWVRIECTKRDTMLSPEEIHEMVWTEVKQLLK